MSTSDETTPFLYDFQKKELFDFSTSLADHKEEAKQLKHVKNENILQTGHPARLCSHFSPSINRFHQRSEDKIIAKQSLFKSEFCRRSLHYGFCQFDGCCSFAHSFESINIDVKKPRRYKSKKCKSYHENGFCAYGTRCRFSHGDDDANIFSTFGTKYENLVRFTNKQDFRTVLICIGSCIYELPRLWTIDDVAVFLEANVSPENCKYTLVPPKYISQNHTVIQENPVFESSTPKQQESIRARKNFFNVPIITRAM
ncbi:hypothetical protein PCE1_003144 [Barthelona sp. PCE]